MDVFDILLAPIYLIAILVIGYKYTGNKLKTDSTYKYFMPGLIAKIGGAIALGLVYLFYYGGGDTVNYFDTASAFVDILFTNFDDFVYLYFGKPQFSEYYLLNTQYPFIYWVNDAYAFFVSKCYALIVLISFKSYFASAIVTATVCYLGVWRLFLVFVREFPNLAKQFSWSILFIPSVVFWGSGIMKDSITFSATCLFVHGFYWVFVQKKFKWNYLIALLLAIYFLLMIKPYILVALIPGSLLWLSTLYISKIKNIFIRLIFIPSIFTITFGVTIFVLQSMGDTLGRYSLDRIVTTASGAQQDLKQGYYQGNSFDIGDYEPTLTGMLSVSHKAIFATLFRPTLIDVKNIVMLISAIENGIVLMLSIYLLIKLKVFRFFGLINSHPLLLFSFIFSIFFAFSVGVSVSNFGTLVRLKIPCMPFFIACLVIINSLKNEKHST